VPFDLAQAAILSCRHWVDIFSKKAAVDDAVELVNIHGVDPLLQPLVFGLMAPDRLLVFAALVGVGCVQRIRAGRDSRASTWSARYPARPLLLLFARFFGQIVDYFFAIFTLDSMHELFRGTLIAREHHAFRREVHLHVRPVRPPSPILEVAVEPIGLLDQHHSNRRMRLEMGDHLAEGRAARPLHIHIFMCRAIS
jgi:hypothetical protein